MNPLSDTISQLLPFNSRTTPSGWRSFGAPCCHHRGHSADKKKRGGILQTADSISYSCFNCGYKASWQLGKPVSRRMRKLLSWMGASDDTINRVCLQMLKINQGSQLAAPTILTPSFVPSSLPSDSTQIEHNSTDPRVDRIKRYMNSRQLELDQGYNYYWSSNDQFRNRLIIPFYYNKQIVGYTARSIHNPCTVKYLMSKQSGYVFNLDRQTHDRSLCVVTEGVIDAIHTDGTALLTNEISQQQALLLNQLKRDIIVVPDRDRSGKNLIERSIELGYAVSMPDWKPGIKDASDAVAQYGKLYTLYSIVNSAEHYPLKIRLRAKKWFSQ